MVHCILLRAGRCESIYTVAVLSHDHAAHPERRPAPVGHIEPIASIWHLPRIRTAPGAQLSSHTEHTQVSIDEAELGSRSSKRFDHAHRI